MTGQGSQRNREQSWSSRTTSCPSGKWTYPTRRAAKEHAKRMRSAGLRPYECLECGKWHVGHKPDVTMRGDMSARDFHARRVRYAYPDVSREGRPEA